MDQSATGDEKPTEDKSINDDDREKLYKTLYEQYYSYYYNYYFQLHTSAALTQETGNPHIEEDSKAMAITASAYAAKARVEQYDKELQERKLLEKKKSANASKKRQHCVIIRYVDYVLKHGTEFESSARSSGRLKFLDPDNGGHAFYRDCLQRARKALPPSTVVEPAAVKPVALRPRWQDYVKRSPSAAPLLPGDCMVPTEGEQRLAEVAEWISALQGAEEAGRAACASAAVARVDVVEVVKATRKRKATEFMERVRQKAAVCRSQAAVEAEQQEEDQQHSDREHRHHKRSKRSSKHRKHRHR